MSDKQLSQYQSFKEKYTLQERKRIFEEYQIKYPETQQVILEKHPKCNLQVDSYIKFFPKRDVKLMELLNQVKQKLRNEKKIDDKTSVQYLIGNKIIHPKNQLLSDVLQKDNEDGFLYIEYITMECFG